METTGLSTDLKDLGGWFPDETLFSLASRYHVLVCSVRASDTCRLLFGHHRSGGAHDFPCRIDDFVARTHGRLGGRQEVLRHHTILPFFLPTVSELAAANAMAAMFGSSTGTLKAELGLLASGFRANHVLKACRACMANDRLELGTAYWHREHQLPGVWVCRAHREPLLAAAVKATGVGRFLWYLPNPSSLTSGAEIGARDLARPEQVWYDLADCSLGLASLPQGFHFDPATLAYTHRIAAGRRGWMKESGRLRLELLSQKALAVCEVFRGVEDFRRLPHDARGAEVQFANAFRTPRARGHPLKLCLMALIVHGEWEAFMACYADASNGLDGRHSSDAPPVEVALEDAADRRRVQLLHMLTVDKLAVSAAARRLEVAVGTAMSWASSLGIAVPRRPKTLLEELRRQAIDALRRGIAKAEVAAKCAISVQAVTRLLATEPGLRADWKDALERIARRSARADWLKATRRRPQLLATEVRRNIPAAYSWLYRHDRAWLNEQAAKCPSAPRSNNRKTDWDARDQVLSQHVQRVALEIMRGRESRQRITRGELCHHIQALKPVLSKLDQLPLTRAAIDRATRPVSKADWQSELF